MLPIAVDSQFLDSIKYFTAFGAWGVTKNRLFIYGVGQRHTNVGGVGYRKLFDNGDELSVIFAVFMSML